MGQQEFGEKLYYQFSLERLVPDDHLLRRIAERVDFFFIRPLCRPYYSHTGQPSVDPVVLFKLLLVGYLYGITSERRLAEEVRLTSPIAGSSATTSMSRPRTTVCSRSCGHACRRRSSSRSSSVRLSCAGRPGS